MEKKIQKLDDNLLENTIGGIKLRGFYSHVCDECHHSWHVERRDIACPSCGSLSIHSWPD